MSIQSQVIKIIADQALLDIEDVTPTSTLDDLGIDSMGIVESIFVIEETFDVQVPFNANAPEESDFDISSIETIVAAVTKLVEDKG